MNETKNKSIFQRIISLLERIELKFFVFFLMLLLLTWPFMSVAGDRSFFFYFIYFFSIWLALMVYLILSRAGEDNENKDD
jgi:hypothetical protein